MGQKLSARLIARRIAERLHEVGDLDATPPSVNTIYAWEKFERHPSIANFAAWARALALRLYVEIGPPNRKVVLVKSDEAAELARKYELMTPEQRMAVLTIARQFVPIEPDDSSSAGL